MIKSTAFTVMLGLALGIGGFYISKLEASQISGVIDAHADRAIIEDAQAFILPASQTTYLPIRDYNVSEPEISARSAILVDGVSNRVLFAKDPDQRLPIASITKLMTAIVVLEDLHVNEIYTISAEDLNVDGNGADFISGEKLRGTELMKIMLLKSSNDAANVFATSAYNEGVDFVGLMNAKAVEFGMTSTHFSDPAGLNDTETYSTASDIVKLVRAAMKYDFIKDVATTVRIDVPTLGGTMYHVINTNKLLSSIPRILLGKTGNTTGALGTMVLAAYVDDNENYIISVVLGSNDRFGETKKLIDWGKKAHQWN